MEPDISEDMTLAGIAAFRAWFADPIFDDTLLELPSQEEMAALVGSVFRSMISCRPVDTSQDRMRPFI